MIPEVEGTRPWGPRGKRSPSVSKGPKLPIQLLQLLKNSPREVKRAYNRYILGSPWSHPGYGFYGARREGPSRSPRFLRPWCRCHSADVQVPHKDNVYCRCVGELQGTVTDKSVQISNPEWQPPPSRSQPCRTTQRTATFSESCRLSA